jgi:hypothetical protein
MEKFVSGIGDRKKSDPGFGINIPDPQHCPDHRFIDMICTLYGTDLFEVTTSPLF